MLTDFRDTVLLASRASDLGATEFLAHFQARAARRVADDDSGLFDDYLGPELLSTDDAGFA